MPATRNHPGAVQPQPTPAPQPAGPPPVITDTNLHGVLPPGATGYWSPTQGGWTWNPVPAGTVITITRTQGYGVGALTNEQTTPAGVANQYYHGPTLANGKPNPSYIGPDANAPAIAVTWKAPPVIDGTLAGDPPPPPGGGPPPPSAPPSHSPYAVDLSSIRATESHLLSKITTSTTDYDNLKSYVASTKWWIFAASSAAELTPQNLGHGVRPVAYNTNELETQAYGNAEDTVLLQVADAIHAAGVYMAALNQAGQLYARADIASFVPES